MMPTKMDFLSSYVTTLFRMKNNHQSSGKNTDSFKNFFVEPYCGKLGKVRLLTRGVDFKAKILLNKFDFVLKSDFSLLLINNGGIIVFIHYKIVQI